MCLVIFKVCTHMDNNGNVIYLKAFEKDSLNTFSEQVVRKTPTKLGKPALLSFVSVINPS